MNNLISDEWAWLVSVFKDWANTPENGKFGSPYGGRDRIEAWLAQPSGEGLKAVYAKAEEDLSQVLKSRLMPELRACSLQAFSMHSSGQSGQISLRSW